MQIDLGVAVKNDKGEYAVLTGNQTGALLLTLYFIPKATEGNLAKKWGCIKNNCNE